MSHRPADPSQGSWSAGRRPLHSGGNSQPVPGACHVRSAWPALNAGSVPGGALATAARSWQIAVIPRASAHAREEGSGRAPPGGQGAGRRSFGHNSQWPAGATSPGGATERVTMKRLLWPLAVVIVPAVIDARTPRARRVGHVLGHG